MNDQFFEMDESESADELLGFDRESEAADYEEESSSYESGTLEEREIELAAELLSVSGDRELDELFGRIMKGARGILNSTAGRKLKGLLRTTARRALPMAGQAIGGYFGGSRGSAFGSQAGSAGAQLLGLETEGLSPEDRELNVARGIVRLAGDAAQKLGAASGIAASNDPMRAAQSALLAAARRHAPGLASSMSNGGTGTNNPRVNDTGSNSTRSGSSGRWIRRDGKIVVLGI